MKLSSHSRMMAGPDGNSLACGFCGDVNYVKVPTSALMPTVECPACKQLHPWRPEVVCCANPEHTSVDGCGSALCWKRRSDLR